MQEEGNTGKVGKWLHDYLSERTQAVIANNKISTFKTVISGVPQGRVIGLLLFLIFIDSISSINLDTILGTFADDTRVTRSVNDKNDVEILQNELIHLQEWAVMNNMAFNGTKFQCLKYGYNDDIKSEFDYFSEDLEEVIEETT